MRNRKVLKGAIVLFIVAAMFFSSVAMANTQEKETQLTLNTTSEGSGSGARGAIVWDNGMDYTGLGAAQWDEPGQFDAYLADDFFFDEPTEVCDVHWIGGYWNGDPAEFDWCISFYYDDGTGESPVGLPYSPSYAGPFCYSWAEIDKTEIEPGYYEMNVDLPYNIPFEPGKYWISIWGVGAFPPQSGWGIHDDQILLHEAVFGSDYFGITFWTDTYDVFGYSADCCFQLTTKEEGIPAICCDPGLLSWSDVPPGGTVTGSFFVWNCGEPGSVLAWEVDTWPNWGTWTFNPPSGTLLHPDGITVDVTVIAPTQQNTPFSGVIKVINVGDPTDYCEMQTSLKTPRMRGFQNTFFLRILQQFPNAFPMLRYIMGI
jgi:hypothetical protein